MNKDRGYTDEDLAEVSDNPEWTEEDFAAAKPFHEVCPELAASIDRSQNVHEPAPGRVSVGIDQDLVERFQADGPDWQARLNAALRKATAG